MKQQAFVVASLLALVAFGCQKKGTNDVAMNDSVIDISASPQAGYQTGAQPAPVAPQPVVYDSMNTTQSQPGAGTAAAVDGSAYTVQKGDTLYSIARQRYGDGKQWERIAAANPGLDPTKLRIGQTITIP